MARPSSRDAKRREPGEVLALLADLHGDVDRDWGRLEAIHRSRLVCRLGCTACCVDELTVFEIEAERVRREFGELLRRERPHPPGACAMLDDAGRCRIYSARPYVCRTQGLPLRWIDDGPDGQPAEYRDICELNDEGPPLTELEQSACWTLGPIEARLRDAQLGWDGTLQRIGLRELFDPQPQRR